MQASKKYYDEITMAKGIGILCVVLGHAIKQTGVDNNLWNTLVQVIYSFHMPLFFVLSGFVSVKILSLERKDFGGYIKSRAVRLLIPYVVVGILYMPLKYVLSQYARKPYDFANSWRLILGDNPNTTMWFLYILFWVSVLSMMLIRKNTLVPFLLIGAALSLATFHFGWEIKVSKYFFFFVSGIFMRVRYESFEKLFRKVWFIIVMALIFIGGNILIYKGVLLAGFFTSIAGTMLCMVLCKEIVNGSQGKRGVLYGFGDSSMDIYILSDIVQTVLRLAFLNILGLSVPLVILIGFVGGMYGSVFAAKIILRRFKIFRILLFGEWKIS